MLEREGEALYNAAAVITPAGILGMHRKLHMPCLGIDWFNDPGDRPFRVFETAGAKLGVNICFDCSFPESGRVLKLLGAELLTIPTNWPVGSDMWLHTPHVRAAENHFYVAVANRVGEERGFRFAGHSMIVDVMGKVLAEAGDAEETIVYGEIEPALADQNRVIRVPGKWEVDRIGARRPEMYSPIAESRPR
jgi:predicted amidohydrolase